LIQSPPTHIFSPLPYLPVDNVGGGDAKHNSDVKCLDRQWRNSKLLIPRAESYYGGSELPYWAMRIASIAGTAIFCGCREELSNRRVFCSIEGGE
jgi:hypothetical protein